MSKKTRIPLKSLIFRGLRKKCPNCGKSNLFLRWIHLHKNCQECGIRFLKSQGDIWAFFLIFDRILLLPIIAGIYFSFMPVDKISLVTFFLVIISLFLYTTPHRYGLCVALDYYTRLRWEDEGTNKSAGGEANEQMNK